MRLKLSTKEQLRSVAVGVGLVGALLGHADVGSLLIGQPHRLEHMRRLQRPRRAGRAGGDGNALEIQRNQERLGLDPVEADVGRVDQSLKNGGK